MMEEEKEINGEVDIDEIKEEEDNITKLKLNRNRSDDKKKIIMYVILGILMVVVATLIVLLVMNKKPDDKDDKNTGNDVVDKDAVDVTKEEDNKLGYVSCDDNTALLNVRNSTSGSIIDGLSCYKEVTIEEELEKTDACDKWYKISYTKNGSSYTGYACGTYIKRLEVSSDVIKKAKDTIGKAINYYMGNRFNVYCGKTSTSKTVDFGNNATGKYLKSEYKSIEELKSYVLSFLDDSLIKIKIELSDIDNPKYYDNYYEIDGNLYCRGYSATDDMSYFTGNYDIEVTNVNDSKINVNIAYEYLDKNSDCDMDELSKCGKGNFVYDIGKITIENNIITKMDFPE